MAADPDGRVSLADRAVSRLVRGYFTKTNLLLHAIVYPILMSLEGGDFHLFLDGISIEAVFVGLLVGISTKRIIDRQGGIHDAVHWLHDHLHVAHPDKLDSDQAPSI